MHPGLSLLSTNVGSVELTGRPALVLVGVAAAVVAAGGAALAVGVPSAPSHPPEQVVSLPADGHSGATLEIRSGTTLLDVKVANLGGTSGRLLRASVPGDAPRPEITVAWRRPGTFGER